MAGHSKWNNIKRRKGAVDAKRGLIFSKLAKEIAVAARMGGGDPATNAQLRTVLLNAKAENMPKDNVERAIKKGTGELPGTFYEEMTYEGYGPGGVALLIEVLTDNKNRTVAEIRHLLGKHGGSMAESGAVRWNFEPKGSITLPLGDHDEESMFEKAIEAGAEDLNIDGETIYITTESQQVHAVAEALQGQGLEPETVNLTMVPKTTVKAEGSAAQSVLRLLEVLEDHDDVQNVYANFDISEEEIAAAMSE